MKRLANLRAGITPTGRTGVKKTVTRLASEHIHVWANTWVRRVEIDLDEHGRLSVVVRDGHGSGAVVVDVELPAHKGEYEGAFTPTVKAIAGVGFEVLEVKT